MHPRLILIALLLAPALPAIPQTAGPSDAAILVQPSGAQTTLAVTFSSAIPHAAVKSRLARLARAGGWQVAGLDIRDEEVTTNERFGSQKGLGRQTGASAQLINAPQTKDGGFLLQPYVEAFSDLRRIEILYFVNSQPDFIGLRDFQSPAVAVTLLKDGGPYRYLVEYRDVSRGIPRLPLTQAPAAAAPPPPVKAHGRGPSLAFVIAVAAGCALVVLAAMLALGRMRAAQRSRLMPPRASGTQGRIELAMTSRKDMTCR